MQGIDRADSTYSKGWRELVELIPLIGRDGGNW